MFSRLETFIMPKNYIFIMTLKSKKIAAIRAPGENIILKENKIKVKHNCPGLCNENGGCYVAKGGYCLHPKNQNDCRDYNEIVVPSLLRQQRGAEPYKNI